MQRGLFLPVNVKYRKACSVIDRMLALSDIPPIMEWRIEMKKRIILAMSLLLAANFVLADSFSCGAASEDTSVPATTRNQLAKACEHRKLVYTCNKLADDRKMLGDKRNNFLQNCTGHATARRR